MGISDNESLKNNFSSSELVLDTSLLGTLPLRVPFSDFASFSLSLLWLVLIFLFLSSYLLPPPIVPKICPGDGALVPPAD